MLITIGSRFGLQYCCFICFDIFDIKHFNVFFNHILFFPACVEYTYLIRYDTIEELNVDSKAEYTA